jgi:hypothetical protein
MSYNTYFQNLINEVDEGQYIGLGNPDAKILFIGKEAGLEIGENIYHGTVKSWKERKFDYSKRYVPEINKLRNLNHTWQRYQKLYDNILLSLDKEEKTGKEDNYEISFIENVFTTELSNLHAPNTKDAKKQEKFDSELKIRKNKFFKCDFIQNFPITIIFASDKKYIETYSGEVCELFNVKFEKLHNENAKDKIWIHTDYSKEKHPRLLIHTRQLTNRITIELIPNLCDLVVKFIKKNSIDIETNKTLLPTRGVTNLG